MKKTLGLGMPFLFLITQFLSAQAFAQAPASVIQEVVKNTFSANALLANQAEYSGTDENGQKCRIVFDHSESTNSKNNLAFEFYTPTPPSESHLTSIAELSDESQIKYFSETADTTEFKFVNVAENPFPFEQKRCPFRIALSFKGGHLDSIQAESYGPAGLLVKSTFTCGNLTAEY